LLGSRAAFGGFAAGGSARNMIAGEFYGYWFEESDEDE
jgi:hypothetical protein